MKTGVIVGRFQVPSLHPGHHYLINEVRKRSERVIMVLGEPAERDFRNALPASIRIRMIREMHYIDAFEVHLDRPGNDELWSVKLDELLQTYLPGDITLYGSRDCFKPHYYGNYPVVEIDPFPEHNGTDLREAMDFNFNEDFRKGIFYSFMHKTK